jgi:hypothetical protein
MKPPKTPRIGHSTYPLVVAALVFIGITALVFSIATDDPAKSWIEVDRDLEAPFVNTGYAADLLSQLPLLFMENKGQANDEAHFLVDIGTHRVLFRDNDVVFQRRPIVDDDQKMLERVVLRFEGHSMQSRIIGTGTSQTGANFYRGRDRSQWYENVPNFEGVQYAHLYPGIDLQYLGSKGVLKREFYIAAGIDPTVIRMIYEGAHDVRIDAQGALVLETPFGALKEDAPYAYQDIGGQRVEVEARYLILGEGLVGFAIDGYDTDHRLVIDPPITYGTYIGGSTEQVVNGVAIDADGMLLVSGTTLSQDFPTMNATQDALSGLNDGFVVKVDPVANAYVFATFLAEVTTIRDQI